MTDFCSGHPRRAAKYWARLAFDHKGLGLMRASISCSQFFAKVVFTGLLVCLGVAPVMSQQTPPRSPSDTVREFYKAMREKKFREAFSMSIYKPAIEPLKPQEFEDLRPDFEKMAAVIPVQVNLGGEQVSGDIATVFVKVKEGDAPEQAEPVTLILVDGAWIIGDKENQAIVKKAGKQFFFNARIDTHHDEVQAMLTRVSLAQLLYSQQHEGLFADLATLISLGLLPKDLEGTESTGYRFHVNALAGGKSWNAAAEPAQYGRTGRLSFYLDPSGVRSSDTGGKPLTPGSKN
ncbi:MAG TPA: hypothetical protein DHU55_17130 [Blastocatellia bacterium]|nr:hypothetical protein [Blastocatellia bacterium]